MSEANPDVSCEIDNYKKLVEKSEFTIVAVTKKGCPSCENLMPKIPEAMPKNVSIIEVPTEDGDIKCDQLADALEAPATPSFYVYHKGELINKVPIVQMDPTKDPNPIDVIKKTFKEKGHDMEAMLAAEKAPKASS